MNLRGKIFHKENKKVYRVLNIDFFNQKVDVVNGDDHITFDFKDIIFLESTRMKGDKGYIYKGDFIIAIKEQMKFKGIVKRDKDGWFYLEYKKLNLKADIENLIEQGYKIINLGNATVYFEKIKANKK